MRADTKAQSIPKAVKVAVAARDSVRDWPCCVKCGRAAPGSRPWAWSCAHYIARSQGGLGIEENLLTLCPDCHREYDQSANRRNLRMSFREYLSGKYPDWDESKLVYHKE